MSFITIQCRLVASEKIRRQLWDLMADRNTPLVNELLKRVSQHRDFETWQRIGTVPDKPVRELCEPFKTQPEFEGQPGRFYTSASLMVTYTYKSWLALQRKRRQRLDGKQRWLNTVKSDAELVQISGCNIQAIRDRAREILEQLNAQIATEQNPPKQKRKKKQKSEANGNLMKLLFQAYDATEDVLNRCAIAHLLKNECQVCEQEEDSDAFVQRIQRKQKEIERLEAQLVSRLPKGRDLTGEEFLETLSIATGKVPDDEIEQMLWQAKLLAKPATLPYPIIFGSQTDLRWSTNNKGRICVAFNGLDKAIPDLKQNPLQVYCDQRQLPFFQRFLADWQTYQANKNTYPTGLFLFKTGMLGWQGNQKEREPWQANHLTLHCTIDTCLLTAEGTERLRQEGINRLSNQLADTKASEELTKDQQAYIKRQQSSLIRLQALSERQGKPCYQGQLDVLIGVSIGLVQPITAAVVNVRTGQVLAYRSTRQLLGDNYRLLNRQRQQQQNNTLKRYKNQTKGYTRQPSESELGQYVDRLLAKSVIELAKQFQAGSIVLPHTQNLREHLAAEINAKAERKSDSKEVQDKYAKQVRISIHRWSYDRLLSTISSQANKLGLAIETIAQSRQGTPQEKARDVAIAAYHFRQVSSN
ncbi:MAG TPA: type V CRISPR-associated protein Cas12k [Trichocoleus sp.]|jgi:IS605 OrfB family transposase